MKEFFKPSKGRIILTLVLFVVFVFLGVSHVQVCKMPPCQSMPAYSSIIMYTTLWPFAVSITAPHFWNFLDTIIPLLFYVLWVFYYYIIACLWFYKKDKWKIKNYALLIIAIVIIFFSIFNMYNNGKFIVGPQFGKTTCNSNQDCVDNYIMCPQENEMPVCIKEGAKGILDASYCECGNLNKKY